MVTAGTAISRVAPSSYAGTQVTDDGYSTSLRLVRAGHSWGHSWSLSNHLFVEIRTSRAEVLAITFLTVEEYGAGDTMEAAICDLLSSLSDYYESLEVREERLAPSALEDLQRLRHLLNRKPTN
jgi:hypothetical protein